MEEKKELFDRQRFAKILCRQWASTPNKSEKYQMVYEYVQAVAAIGNYSVVYDVPDKRVARVLDKYGLLEA